MSNKYCNLDGNNEIMNEYTKINDGFAGVEADALADDTKHNNHVIGVTERHDSNHIDNASDVGGGTVTLALNALKALIENLDSVFSTDVERINAINQAVSDAFGADDTLEASLLSVIAGVQAQVTAHKDTDVTVHPSSKITFDPSGSTLVSVLVDTVIKELSVRVDTNKTSGDNNLTAHQGSVTAHGSSSITNQSSVTGSKITDALNALKDSLAAIVANVTVDSEVILARNSAVKTVAYATLDARLEAAETDIEKTKTPQLSTPVDFTGVATTIPTTALDKAPFNVTVKGNTVTVLEGQNFESAGNGWGASIYLNGAGYSDNSPDKSVIGTKCFKGVVSVVNDSARIDKNNLITKQNKYYMVGWIFPKYNNLTLFQLGGKQGTMYTPTANQWNRISDIIDCAGFALTNAYARFYHQTSTQYALNDIIYFDGIMIIDLTENGLASKTKAELDAMFVNFLPTGTHSTLSGRVKDVGKNIFGGQYGADKIISVINNPTYAYKTVVDGRRCLALVGNSYLVGKKMFSGFEPNTQYTIQFWAKRDTAGANGGYFYITYTDSTFTMVSPSVDPWSLKVTTSTAGKSIEGLYTTYGSNVICYFDYDTLMIEKGPTASVVEPYTYSEAYTPIDTVLRNLPNGVKDDRTINTGEKNQKASDPIILNGSSGWSTYGDSTNGISYYMRTGDGWTAGKNILPDSANSAIGKCSDGDFYSVASGISTSVQRGMAFLGATGRMYIAAEKTKIDAMAGEDVFIKFKAYLDLYPVTLTYQLLTPILSEGIPQVLTTGPNHTLIVDLATREAKFTLGEGIRLSLPVKNLEAVNRLSGKDRIPVDLSTCTVYRQDTNSTAEAGTTTTNVKITAHGLLVGDRIRNITRNNAIRKITAVVDANNVTVAAVDAMTTGDTIERYKASITDVSKNAIIGTTGAVAGQEYEIIYEHGQGTLPTITYSFALNLAAGYNQVVDLQNRIAKELGDVWMTLLPLADKEVAMYIITSIAVPASATAADCAAKINEIINIWKG